MRSANDYFSVNITPLGSAQSFSCVAPGVHPINAADHFDRTGRVRLAARLARKLDELGFDVTLSQREVV